MKTHKTKRVYRVRCKSGLMGWRTRLQNNYASMSEFESASKMYGVARRLGARSNSPADLLQLWESNPVIEGSVQPSDLRNVKA